MSRGGEGASPLRERRGQRGYVGGNDELELKLELAGAYQVNDGSGWWTLRLRRPIGFGNTPVTSPLPRVIRSGGS